MDLEQTRTGTHEKLIDRLSDLEEGRDIKSLSSFAKAYLGMYLDLDKKLTPEQRVCLLADEEVLASVWTGFDVVLMQHKLPDPAETGGIFAQNERIPIGYIALAAMDRKIRNGSCQILDFNDDVIRSLICLHYTDQNEIENPWIISLAQNRPDLFAATLIDYWQAIHEQGCSRFPGFRQVMHDPDYYPVLPPLLIPALTMFPHLDKKTFQHLLLTAFREASVLTNERLLALCSDSLEKEAEISVANYACWLCAAFLLDAEKYDRQLFDYMGRTREKALPVLNFLVSVIDQDTSNNLHITAMMMARLLHMIAPKFHPVKDRFGCLDENVEKVIWLFRWLGHQDYSVSQAVDYLRSVRVMRVYADYFGLLEQTS